MRNRNTVIFLLIVFVLICGYNLYWTVVQFNMDRQLDKVTDAYNNLQALKSNPKDWTAADSGIQGDYNKLLGDAEFSERYKKSTERSFTLGLDLQGGMFVTLEVGIDEIIKQMASSPSDTSLNRAISCALEKQKQQSSSFVPLFTQCYKQLYPNASLGVLFSSEERNISAGTPDAEVERILASEAESAVDRTFNIIRTRIDQFGVVSPNLQKQQSTGRILLELPGVKDPERVRKLLRSTARLEFYTCQTWREGYPVLLEINKKLKNLNDLSGAPVVAVDTTKDDTTAMAAVTPPDSGASAVDDTAASATDIATSDTNQTPFDQLSAEEQEKERVKFRRENPLFALLQPANYDAFNQARSNTPLVGAALPKDTAEINKIFAREDIRALIPQKLRFAWEFKPSTEGSDAIGLIALFDDGSPAMGGEQVSIARQDFDPSNGKPVVSMRMTPEGSREWARITEQNVNKHVAILLDNLVYSYPVVNEAIRGGSSQISGDFTLDESKDLANILKAGQLPVPARIAGEETVGPSLGEENITSGIFSFVVSLILTLILVGLYYGKGGLVANVALILNLIFLLGCSAAFNIVLTLSGIAAVVLTIGMAVDANVLIFERIREELKEGKTLKASIKSGFQHALSSIIDSNVTTFLTALVLYIFGVGPIRGFAVSLMIGIITSLIAALVITRLILEYFANRGNNSLTFGFKWSTTLFDNIKVKMATRKRAFYIFSGTLTVLSFISFAVFGFKTGVDFDGGRQYVIEFRDSNGQPAALSGTDVNTIRTDLTASFENNAPVIKTLRSDNQIMVTTSYRVNDRDATTEVTRVLEAGLKKNFSQYQQKILSTFDVGPTVASDIRNAAFLSVFFSLIIIFLYILLRFRKWQFSLGGVLAIFHDVIITLGVFSFLRQIPGLPFSVEIDQSIIAALLTIIGYSINDTVVVFDRVRENINEMKTSNLSEIFTVSIDQTFSRTIITSGATILSALVLFIFAGDVIRGFVFAILVGIGFGTYSSIFVASALALDFMNWGKKDKQEEPAETPVKA